MRSCCINASTPSTLGVWGGVESVENKAIHVPHHHPLLYRVVWCGVWQRGKLGVVNIGNGRGVISWQLR